LARITGVSNVLARQLAENLRAYRAEHLLSQERLGQLLGKHRTYIGRIESGTENVSLANVAGLAAQLGLHPMDLLDGDIVRADRQASTAGTGAPTLRAAADGSDPRPRRRRRP
jgi:transcriptional regulator with XRE-family HTH domain